MILVLDNHDSFTFNLVQGFGALGAELVVHASDAITIEAIRSLAPSAIVISPGPGKPCDAGISSEALRKFGAHTPILGVCLGHQVICEALGAQVEHASQLMHGRTSQIRHDGRDLFANLPNPFRAARYHSLAVNVASLPSCLEPCAFSAQGELMAVRHRVWPVLGVQFHPESFLTEEGPRLLHNFLRFARARAPRADEVAHG
jgi:para-aminobenzoate synthetase component II